MCLAEFSSASVVVAVVAFASITLFFPRLVTAFSPRALLSFGVFKLRRVLVRKVPSDSGVGNPIMVPSFVRNVNGLTGNIIFCSIK